MPQPAILPLKRPEERYKLDVMNESFGEQGLRSRVAVLGTLADLHEASIQYDLKTLRRIVKDLQPDLLCAEIYPDDWQAGDLNKLPPEYRETLIPLSRRTDIIIIPVSGSKERSLFEPKGGSLLGLRSLTAHLLNNQLRWMQKLASSPRAINSGFIGQLCDWNCALTAWVCGKQVQRDWEQANQVLLNNILNAIQRDPGRRILITVDCRRRHRLEQELRKHLEMDLVDFQYL